MAKLSTDLHNLTAGRRLAWNTVWNLLGEGAPLLVAAVAIPQLLHALGTDQFGVLTLVWMVIGYFTLFDLGVGRALTNLVAQKLATHDEESLPPLIWTGTALIFVFGTAGAVLLAVLSHWFVYSALKVPATFQRETLHTMYLLSVGLPPAIVTIAFRGVLEAYQRFDVTNAIRIPMGVYSFAAPLLVLPLSHRLVPIVTVLVVGRFLGLIAHVIACRRCVPAAMSRLEWQPQLIGPLLRFGGWMTLSNVITPIMGGIDRFLIGAMISTQAVAFYATPNEMATKLLMIPAALATVVFPAFSATLVGDPARARKLYRYALKALTSTLAPIILVVVALARPGLRIWLGADFAANSSLVLQVLVVGVFFNSVAYIPFVLIQGAGRPDWTAKVHIVELPIYLATFWFLTVHWGIVGAALAWSLRTTSDLLVLMLLSRKVFDARPLVSQDHARIAEV